MSTPVGPTLPDRTGARADVSITSPATDTGKVRATIKTDDGTNWPRDADDWKRLIKNALPWIAAAAVVVAGTASYQRNKCECEKDNMTFAELTRRKAGRAGDKTQEAWDDTKEEAKRGWFGLKRKTSEAGDEAGAKWEGTKDAAARKAADVKAAAKGKAEDVKGAATSTRNWASEKAHDVADATKNAAYKAEHAVGAVGSSAIAGASAVEEKTGKVMRDAGKTLEEDGRSSKRYWKGEEMKEDVKKKGICTIM